MNFFRNLFGSNDAAPVPAAASGSANEAPARVVEQALHEFEFR